MSGVVCRVCGGCYPLTEYRFRDATSGRRRTECRLCTNKRSAERRRIRSIPGSEYRLSENATKRRRYALNPAAEIERVMRERSLKPERQRDWHLRTTYNLTLAEFNERLSNQGGVCAVCGGPETAIDKRSGKTRNLHVDHDHACCSGKTSCGRCIRGLLCSRCNQVAGRLNDDVALVRRMANYLERATAPTLLDDL